MRRGEGEMSTERTIGGELFRLVESDLGHAHISDALDELPPERVLAIARGSLRHVESAAGKLRRFIAKHEKRLSESEPPRKGSK